MILFLGSSLLSFLWILFQIGCLSLHDLVVVLGFYHVPSSGTHSAVISSCLTFWNCSFHPQTAGLQFLLLLSAPWWMRLTGLCRFEACALLLEVTHKVSCAPGSKEKTSNLIKAWARPISWYWRASCRGGGWLWLTAGTKTITVVVLGSIHWCEPCWGLPFSHQDLAPPNRI